MHELVTGHTDPGRPFRAALGFFRATPVPAGYERISIKDFLLLQVPLLLLALSAQTLDIEAGMQLPKMLWLATGGFAIHCWLPLALRMPFFLALNAAAICVLFGVQYAPATIALGLLLVVMASLPIGVWYRVLLLSLPAGWLALVRAGEIGNAVLYQVSGMLAGLFMFRTVLYLYETRFEKQAAPPLQRVAYFFLLPNLIFQLFPIVDYKTFKRCFYRRPSREVYTKGLNWIGLGLVQLLVYRLIYHYAVIPSADIDNVYDLSRYLVSTYALIIRLSGIFHLCAGVLCLFGFDLPRTFNRYFLASNFNDLWQRINTYWRDFVMTVLYLPIYMRLKRWGSSGLFVTVILVFIANFFLHTYQWFWIRGFVQITQTDIIFWSALGLFLAFSSVLHARSGIAAQRTQHTPASALAHSAKVLGVFLSMCFLWAMWGSGTWESFMDSFYRAGMPDAKQWAVLVAAALAIIVTGAALQLRFAQPRARAQGDRASYPQAIAYTAACLAALALLSQPAAPRVESLLHADLSPMRGDGINRADTEALARGYYDELMVTNNAGSRVWEVESHEEQHRFKEEQRDAISGLGKEERLALKQQARDNGLWVGLKQSGIVFSDKDSILKRFKPDQLIEVKGVPTRTNALGFKDRPYSLAKPPHTLRMALLGGSPELGLGIPEDQIVDNLLEDRLTAAPAWEMFDKVEILNLAMGNYTMLEQLVVTDEFAPQFSPDVLLLFLHDVDSAGKALQRLSRLLTYRRLDGEGDSAGKVREHAVNFSTDGRLDNYDYLRELGESLEQEGKRKPAQIEKALKPREIEIYHWILRSLVEHARRQGIIPMVVYCDVVQTIPNAGEKHRKVTLPFLASLNVPVLDLSHVFDVEDRSRLMVAPWDFHPNALGHQRMADALFEQMTQRQNLFIKHDASNRLSRGRSTLAQ